LAGVVVARVQEKERQVTEETIKWFAAVDWGSAKHQVCVLDAQGGVAGEREFPHSGAGLMGLADWVQSITGEASLVAIAIEVPHGPVVDVLLDRGFIVHSINPKQLDRLRDRFSVVGAQDDRRDAQAAADGLRPRCGRPSWTSARWTPERFGRLRVQPRAESRRRTVRGGEPTGAG
jgi:hypothetical protein